MLKIYMLFLLVIEFLFFVCLYIIKWGKKILGYIVEIIKLYGNDFFVIL